MLINEITTDEQLIENVKTKNCSDSFVELKNRHGGIYTDTIKKRLGKNFPSLFDDMIELIDINFMLFINNYDPSRNAKFVTYVCNGTRFICLNKIKAFYQKIDLNQKVDNFEEMCENLSNDENLATKNNFEFILEKAHEAIFDLKDERAIDIIKRRWLGERKESLKEIAKSYDLTGQQILNIQTKSLQTIQNSIKRQLKKYE